MKKMLMLIICLLLCSCSKVDDVFRNVIIDDIEDNHLTLTFVGDALVHTPIYEDAYRNGLYDFSSIFTEIKDEFKDRDILFYNQETIIGGSDIPYSGYPNFNTPSYFADEMIKMGFNLVSRANNHTLDKGEVGVYNACNYWNKKDVLTNGSACTKDERDNIQIRSKNGISYALLSYTTILNSDKPKEDYYVNVFSYDKALSDLEKVCEADLIIVSMHWGCEYEEKENENQREIAKFLKENGADIIVGTHPHVIEPVIKEDDTVVFYSLGNFVSSQSIIDDYERRIGLLANVDVVKSDGKINIVNLNTKLIYTYSNGTKDYKIYTFEKLNDKILPNYKNYKVKYEKIIKMYDNNIQVR